MTRASADAHEASLSHLPSLVCAGPPRRSSLACVFGIDVSDRAAGGEHKPRGVDVILTTSSRIASSAAG
jgi:hypothetical protein